MFVFILVACGGSSIIITTPGLTSTANLAASQVMTFPNVGTADIAVMDPAQGPDTNSAIAIGMIYTGLL